MADGIQTSILEVGGASYRYYPIEQIEGADRLPRSLAILLENIMRNVKDPEHARQLAQRVIEAAQAGTASEDEVEFSPARVLFQDFTGVPVFVDFASMRDACLRLGADPALINPQVPCDLVIDHSVIADEFGCPGALEANMKLEFERNRERYDFLKWAQESFDNVSIVPPGQGICHQLNMERFGKVVMASEEEDGPVAYFDTVVGTDSHTTTIGGLGVLGYGVGGIEAEAAALGQPITTLVPPAIGVRLTGRLSEGVSAMDVALTFAEMLRAEGVVGCYVECFGPGVAALSATQRACISNMTPEYGCTCTLFPVDGATLDYLRVTGRDESHIQLVEAYAKAQGLFYEEGESERTYAKVLELDLGAVVPSLAGPSRPHERFDCKGSRRSFIDIRNSRNKGKREIGITVAGQNHRISHGAVAIAAVTSCTTATDPAMMIQCGLLARNAAAEGLTRAPWVKTVMAPGSRATQLMLKRAGLEEGLQALGFDTCGFGCMSCIGNSGPILPEMHELAEELELASVLSGNRNFEGRISPDVAQNYLASPARVVAYALAGSMDFDFENTPLAEHSNGTEVFLRDIWPTDAEVAEVLAKVVDRSLYEEGNAGLYEGDEAWNSLGREPSVTFPWDPESTYVRRAPYFDGMHLDSIELAPVRYARIIAKLGDFITTDHISPAGSIALDSAAAGYLQENGVAPASFNTYGSRRGNHEVMARGTFANVRLHNLLAGNRMGAWAHDLRDGEFRLMYEVAQAYLQEGTYSIVMAGKMYGSGSSRDWAAKGPSLLGVRAVFAESFERIHRSNLVGMGILPLQFLEGQNADTLGFDGTETFDIDELDFSGGLPQPRQVTAHAKRADGTTFDFEAIVRIDTATEGAYYQNGGILPYVLRQLANQG